MSTLPNEPVSFDVDDTEDWLIQIFDNDSDGNPIGHVGETITADFKDADGNVIFGATTANGSISIIGGSPNGILIQAPWGTVKDLPAAQYHASIATIFSPTSRSKIVDIVVRHSHIL